MELLRKESLAGLAPAAAARVLTHAYHAVIPITPLPYPPLPLSPLRPGEAPLTCSAVLVPFCLAELLVWLCSLHLCGLLSCERRQGFSAARSLAEPFSTAKLPVQFSIHEPAQLLS